MKRKILFTIVLTFVVSFGVHLLISKMYDIISWVYSLNNYSDFFAYSDIVTIWTRQIIGVFFYIVVISGSIYLIVRIWKTKVDEDSVAYRNKIKEQKYERKLERLREQLKELDEKTDTEN